MEKRLRLTHQPAIRPNQARKGAGLWFKPAEGHLTAPPSGSGVLAATFHNAKAAFGGGTIGTGNLAGLAS